MLPLWISGFITGLAIASVLTYWLCCFFYPSSSVTNPPQPSSSEPIEIHEAPAGEQYSVIHQIIQSMFSSVPVLDELVATSVSPLRCGQLRGEEHHQREDQRGAPHAEDRVPGVEHPQETQH